MESLRALDTDDDVALGYPPADEPRMDPPPAIGARERRMHVRAYNHWVGLLHGRAMPLIDDLDPSGAQDFVDHGLLLDFTGDTDNPELLFIGDALRREGGIDTSVRRVADVPPGSLVARLTEHYRQIIAHRAPVGFEAEFTNDRGGETMYRGILMPFTRGGDAVDFIYGVINWKERASASIVADIALEMSRAAAPVQAGTGQTAWAATTTPADDGPPGTEAESASAPPPPSEPIADQLTLARQAADAFATCELRARAAFYRTLSTAYDLALSAERRPRELAALTGRRASGRVSMRTVAELVFGTDVPARRIAEAACALEHARRCGVPAGAMRTFLENEAGGVPAIMAAERRLRRERRSRA